MDLSTYQALKVSYASYVLAPEVVLVVLIKVIGAQVGTFLVLLLNLLFGSYIM